MPPVVMVSDVALIEGEEWRVCIQDERYAVSNAGRVCRKATGGNAIPGRLVHGIIDAHGYRYVTFWQPPKKMHIKVHHLVAIAFLGGPPTKKHCIAHNDGDRANPSLDNIRWATMSENTQDMHKHGTGFLGERHPSHRLTEEDVLRIVALCNAGPFRPYVIGRQFNVSGGAIQGIMQGRSWGWLTGIKYTGNDLRQMPKYNLAAATVAVSVPG